MNDHVSFAGFETSMKILPEDFEWLCIDLSPSCDFSSSS